MTQGKNDNIKKTGLSIEIVILIAVLSGVVFLVIGIVVLKFISKKLKEKKRATTFHLFMFIYLQFHFLNLKIFLKWEQLSKGKKIE